MTQKRNERGANSPVHSRRIQSAERQKTALELRKRGGSFDNIAATMGISKSTAHNLVHKAIDQLKTTTLKKAEELKVLDLERLDSMLVGIYPKATAGDAKAINAVIKLMDQRAKLLGLYAPTKSEVQGEVKHEHTHTDSTLILSKLQDRLDAIAKGTHLLAEPIEDAEYEIIADDEPLTDTEERNG